MSVIQASSAGVRDMADGSLRITLEFEPRHAKDAYALFGTRGTPVAVAALTQQSAQEQAQKETIDDKPKGGPLAKLAGMWCNEPSFWDFLNRNTGYFGENVTDSESAAHAVRVMCHVDSRSELDSNNQASELFKNKIRIPYMEWLQGKQA